MAENFEYIHVGKKIDELLMHHRWTKTDLAQSVGMTPGNAVYLTKRPSIDVVTLHKIMNSFAYDIWQHYPIRKSGEEIIEEFKVESKRNEELKARVAELEKEVERLKTEMAAVKSENELMRDVVAVLKRK
jgi:uncharacterized small protein (DUF1192 family)